MSFSTFIPEFMDGVRQLRGEVAAFLWDRLGHWSQEEDNWEEAERCFRMAVELVGGHYGYCLGVALSNLERYEESLPLLLKQAQELRPDDKSWFQVAFAYEKLGRVRASVDAYLKAISLNSDYDMAWFNMGGVHWNAGEREAASRVWKAAVERFPNHHLAAVLRREFLFILR